MSRISMHPFTERLRRPAAGFGLAFAMVVAACSSAPGAATSSAPAGSPAGGSPPAVASVGAGGGAPIVNCQTISGDDIATIIGKDLADAAPFGDISCTWTFTDSASGASAGSGRTVIVRWANDDTSLALAKSVYPGGEDLSLGDRGYWADSANILYVAKGPHAYAIDLSGFDPTEPRKDMAIAVAQLLLATL